MKLNQQYGQESPLSVQRGAVHEYLGMTVDYSQKGKVTFRMNDFIARLLEEAPDDMSGTAITPAAGHLFQTSPDTNKLDARSSSHGCKAAISMQASST